MKYTIKHSKNGYFRVQMTKYSSFIYFIVNNMNHLVFFLDNMIPNGQFDTVFAIF